MKAGSRKSGMAESGVTRTVKRLESAIGGAEAKGAAFLQDDARRLAPDLDDGWIEHDTSPADRIW